MNFEQDDNHALSTEVDDSDNTMAVLSTLGGANGMDEEGQPLGMDPDAGKAKLSGSTLAVGAVVVVGMVALVGMKMTLKAVASDTNTAEAIAKVDDFMLKLNVAETTGTQGPIEPANGESSQIINELRSDPTEHQVPAEEVQKNPFELVGIDRGPTVEDDTNTGPTQAELEAIELERLSNIARGFRIGSVMGTGEKAVVIINGNMCRIGDEIGDTGFTLYEVDGTRVTVRAPQDASKPWAFPLNYE